jgi:hypothetical protein
VTSLSMGLQHYADADLLTGIYNVPSVGARRDAPASNPPWHPILFRIATCK